MSTFDAPNQEAVGQPPPWVEGSGGGEAAAPATAEAGPAPSGLDAMNKAELLEHAKSIGVSPANNDMTKDELRTAIDEHQERLPREG